MLVGLVMLCASAALAQPECGCEATPADFAAALADDRVDAVVLGTVIWGEGSPRTAPAGLETQHPFPWLRYFLLVEKAWKADVPSLWIERLWGRCGSPLAPGRRYLLTLPKKKDADASVISGESARTVDACQIVVLDQQAGDALSTLGEPLIERDRNQEARSAMTRAGTALSRGRVQCFGAPDGPDEPISLVPGEYTRFPLRLGAKEVTWSLGQNGTGGRGRGAILLIADNPSPCWVRVIPDVLARWAADGSAGRALPGYAGLTWRDGWVPPYWNGTLSLQRDAPWIRTAQLRFERKATMPSSHNAGSGTFRSAGSRTLVIESLEPEPGRLLDKSSSVTATLKWLGPDEPPHIVRPTFEATDSDLVMSTPDGSPAEWSLTAGVPIEISFALASVLEKHRLKEPLTLRFVVDRVTDASKETVDVTKPLLYPRGEEPAPIPVPQPESGPWYSGGDGSSCEKAVVVRGVDTIQQGIAAERAWWRREYPGSKMERQELLGSGDEGEDMFDLITIKTRNGFEVKLCFGINEFWGAPPR